MRSTHVRITFRVLLVPVAIFACATMSLTQPSIAAPTPATESVTLTGRFNWDSGAALHGSVSLIQQILSGPGQSLGTWHLNSRGYVSVPLTLQVWGVYRFELHDAAGNLLKSGVFVVFPSLIAGELRVVVAQATNQVVSAKFIVSMSDLITAGP
jgi:hypothetical protein